MGFKPKFSKKYDGTTSDLKCTIHERNDREAFHIASLV